MICLTLNSLQSLMDGRQASIQAKTHWRLVELMYFTTMINLHQFFLPVKMCHVKRYKLARVKFTKVCKWLKTLHLYSINRTSGYQSTKKHDSITGCFNIWMPHYPDVSISGCLNIRTPQYPESEVCIIICFNNRTLDIRISTGYCEIWTCFDKRTPNIRTFCHPAIEFYW